MTDKQKLLELLSIFHPEIEERAGQLKFGEFRYLFNEQDELVQIQTIRKKDEDGRARYKVMGKA